MPSTKDIDTADTRTGPRFRARLVGHIDQQQSFLAAAHAGRLHHAWMLTGPKGVGKASFAWLAAKYILAGRAQEVGLFGPVEPPENLAQLADDAVALRIEEGSHGDARVLALAENPKTGKMRTEITIDQVHALNGLFTQTATEGGWRVVVIDSVDDMNRSAANALLKVLEEPPKDVLFLLISHSPGRLLPTIRSRCRVLGFPPLSDADVGDFLTSELPELSPETTVQLIDWADGAPGLALNLLDQQAPALKADLLALLTPIPQFDMGAIHGWATDLAKPAHDAKHRLAMDMLLDGLRAAATGAADDIAALFRARLSVPQILELWAELGQMDAQQRGLRLDRSFFWVQLFNRLSTL